MTKDKTPDGNVLSVIVPVYNAKDTIKECVDSILAQKCGKNLEILLMDDGSTDGSAEILDSYWKTYEGNPGEKDLEENRERGNSGEEDPGENSEREDPATRIRVVVRHEQNHGVSHARNRGMDLAEGEWITFVDADDHLEEGFFAELLQAQERLDVALVSCTERILSNHSLTGYEYLEYGIFNEDSHVWGKLFRRGEIEGLRFDEDLRIGEDMLFLLDLALRIGLKHEVACVQSDKYVYLDNPKGAMKQRFCASYRDQIVCWQRAQERIDPLQTALSHYLYTRLAIIRMMAAMLVASKIALLPKKEWELPEVKRVLVDCKSEIKVCKRVNGALIGLEKGYQIKVFFFLLHPRKYLECYKRHKKVREEE